MLRLERVRRQAFFSSDKRTEAVIVPKIKNMPVRVTAMPATTATQSLRASTLSCSASFHRKWLLGPGGMKVRVGTGWVMPTIKTTSVGLK